MRSRTAVGVVALSLVTLTVGCGGSDGDEGDETDTTTASGASVTSFEVGDFRCGGAVSAPVDVTWATEGATAVEIAVDNFTAVRLGASGTRTALVPCDDMPHQISITAIGATGPGETETKDVSERSD